MYVVSIVSCLYIVDYVASRGGTTFAASLWGGFMDIGLDELHMNMVLLPMDHFNVDKFFNNVLGRNMRGGVDEELDALIKIYQESLDFLTFKKKAAESNLQVAMRHYLKTVDAVQELKDKIQKVSSKKSKSNDEQEDEDECDDSN